MAQSHKVVSIELNNSGSFDIIGMIESIQNDACMAVLLDEYGHSDGNCHFSLDDVTQICYDSADERILSSLNRYWNSVEKHY